MDVDGLEALLGASRPAQVEIVRRDLTTPSPLAQEILSARPYAFLDDAPAEERRTLAVAPGRCWTRSRRRLGQLDPRGHRRAACEAWPEARNADELHDALALPGFLAGRR